MIWELELLEENFYPCLEELTRRSIYIAPVTHDIRGQYPMILPTYNAASVKIMILSTPIGLSAVGEVAEKYGGLLTKINWQRQAANIRLAREMVLAAGREDDEVL